MGQAPLIDRLHSLGVEGLAVVELDALVEHEGIGAAVLGHAPLLGQAGDDVGVLVKGQQALVHLVSNLVGSAVAGDMGIQVGGVGQNGHHHVVVRGLGAGGLLAGVGGGGAVSGGVAVVLGGAVVPAAGSHAQKHHGCKQEGQGSFHSQFPPVIFIVNRACGFTKQPLRRTGPSALAWTSAGAQDVLCGRAGEPAAGGSHREL